VDALDFGLRIGEGGYNLFVVGAEGSGRETAVRAAAERFARSRPTPPDWIYVHDFHDPDRPRAIALPAGRGRELAAAVRQLIETARREIPRAFVSDDHELRRRDVAASLAPARAALLDELCQFADARGFVVQTSQTGFNIIPKLGGEPVSEGAFARLPLAERSALDRRTEEIQIKAADTLRRIRQLDREESERLHQLLRDVARLVVGPLFEELQGEYAAHPAIGTFLREVADDLPDQFDDLAADNEGPDGDDDEEPAPRREPEGASDHEPCFARYGVNVLVDNGDRQGAPVVFEHNPTRNNLLGRIDYRAAFGALVTDFSQIKSGSIHRANGGFLVLRAVDVLSAPSSWRALERALRSGRIEIEGAADPETPAPTLLPEPIPLDVKVVVIGTPELYRLLHEVDADFPALFKVNVDFVPDVDWTDEAVQGYAALVSRLVRDRGLAHLDRAAVARVVEHSARLQEHQRKLSTRLGEIADLVTEASFWASEAGRDVVTERDVAQAIRKRRYRSNYLEERAREAVAEGRVRIDVQGGRVGQVNGVSMMDLGDLAFGIPSRITASISPGRGAVQSIEREVELSGPIHAKGVLTLAGYLASAHAQEAPLALAATITFEQSYGEVEGDSASAAELAALLSALAGVPIDQGIAVIGSVDQWGQLQAVGSVTEKIEAFFAGCKALGLTGRQGVIIPSANRLHLMLDDEVIENVAAGRFHVWAIATVDDALPLLVGLPAGRPGPDGRYPEGSVHGLVAARLQRYAELARRFALGTDPGTSPARGPAG
jgi:lon-related putative ATP-dependent protease